MSRGCLDFSEMLVTVLRCIRVLLQDISNFAQPIWATTLTNQANSEIRQINPVPKQNELYSGHLDTLPARMLYNTLPGSP